MMFALHVTGAESPLGRVDKSSLPNLAVMELLIAGVTNPERVFRTKFAHQSIHMWNGLYFLRDDLTYIKWSAYGLEGSLDLRWVPCSVESARFAYNRLSGSVDLTELPENLFELNLFQNVFSGTVSLARLPKDLEILELGSNDFVGLTDFSMLPETLVRLSVSNTKLSGTIKMKDRLVVEVQYSSVTLMK